MFLSFTEQERLKYTATAERTPEEYETYLPYAIALDVEEKWTNQFATLFDKMAQEGRPYTPYWYYGLYINMNNFGPSFSKSFNNSISSSSSRPGSRSGFSGGGGYSGGGGGGGGGGSW